MQYSQIENTDIKLSRFGLGCWTMGGRNWIKGHPAGWSDVNEDEIKEAILFALESGVNHFDNADCYGNGKAESMLALILGAKSKDVIVASKVGYLQNEFEHAYVAANIRRQCEKSLKNLSREYIDIYYFHHGDFGEKDCYLDEAMDEMLRLKDEGKIREIGLSAYSTKDFVRLIPIIKPTIIQSWANLTDDKFVREKTIVRQLIDKHKILFVAFSPLNRGLLTGKYSLKNLPVFEDGDHRKVSQKFTKEALENLDPKLEKLKDRFGDLVHVAIGYLLANQAVGAVIPGFRNKEQVQMNLDAFNSERLKEEDLEYIRGLFDS